MRTTLTAVALGALAFVIVFLLAKPVGDFLSGITPLARPAPPLPPAGERLPFSLPEGFAAYLYADDVPGARVMIRDPKNALLVSLTREGKVVALPNLDSDGKADRIVTVLDGLNNPHGLVVLCPETGFESEDQDGPSRPPRLGEAGQGGAEADCTLYVAESHRVASYRYDADTYTATIQWTHVNLPDDGGHDTRTLMLHPDKERILVSVGSSCNVCTENDERRASILAFDPILDGFTVFATGLRNTVFMTTHYVTGAIWSTEMGRDLLGDDIPPDEINILREGRNYGWPICYGDNIHDTRFDPEADASRRNGAGKNTCVGMESSHIDLQAHSAPLGLVFIPEDPPRLAGASGGEAGGWPEEWWYDLLVAYHGSWNRSVPTGYKIVRFPLDARGNPEGRPVDFMTGFMTEEGDVIGRPVDILVEPGGTMFVSDDRAGAIYRIVRTSLE